ncbi:hypothetical protein [Paenibacillus larvae]|uniref:hypothetical protein n=1 Tax=Paenibacillus larvae TaxID=1464 RepID=UPI0001695521|nr:hypothetical protein [Paenibacillus larvae]ETK27404.1 hypothetical protein ERIC1_1c08490 [Paenibacillus larvae subsp. larvae DSM 25719]MDT2268148.1 hypothetical protein [Paenibacillus larvae]MDT2277872.1 hypothetical protein [Paenibacillus larvae]MDT2288965.1 hypothetical protein [Paenibacillus larvae]MDT2306302.1 hypothetical protein [Paenibacillus larvae]
MNNDIEKELWAKLVDFVEFVIRSAAKENLEDLEFGVAYMLQTSKSLGFPEELLSSNETVILEVYQKLKAERDATKLQ